MKPKYLRIVFCILFYSVYRLFLMPALPSLDQSTSDLYALPSATKADTNTVHYFTSFEHQYSELETKGDASTSDVVELISESQANGRIGRSSDESMPATELLASKMVLSSAKRAISVTARNVSVEAVDLPTVIAKGGRTRTHATSPKKRRRLSIVTAADGGHFLTLVGALWALRRTEAESTRIIIYDLGLKPCQRRYLDGLVSCFRSGTTVVRSFDYSQYPSYFNVTKHAGCYAWKPAIVHEVLAEVSDGDSVVWIDAGTETGRRVGTLLADSYSYSVDGFISTVTTGTMDQWTHQGMKDWFAVHTASLPVAATIKRERAASPCNGAFLGFRKGSDAERAIVPTWFACAMDKNCIAPEGSSRRNHRQDQSALTLLVKLHLHPGRGCTPLRADGSMRFWRDIYYEVNAPIVFQGYSKSSCNNAKHEDWLVCRSSKRRASPEIEHSYSTLAVVVILSKQDSIEERKIQEALAALRRLFWPLADLHVFIALGPKCSSVQLTRLEQMVGMDSTVSVLNRPSNAVMGQVLEGFEGAFVVVTAELACFAGPSFVGCESPQSLPSEGTEEYSVGDCSMIGSSDIVAVAAFVSNALTTGYKDAMAGSPKSETRRTHALSSGSGTRTPHVAARNPPTDDRPLLVAEAVSSHKQDQKRLRKLKKELPEKGVVLALFGRTAGERSALALSAVLMGALGFGLRWTPEGSLAMAELERIDALIQLSGGDNPAVEPFTRKSKKEVKHAPWIMTSEHLPQTFSGWRAHLSYAICVVLCPEGGGSDWAKEIQANACADAPTVVVTKLDDAGLYYLYHDLKLLLGNVRALTTSEVKEMASLI